MLKIVILIFVNLISSFKTRKIKEDTIAKLIIKFKAILSYPREFKKIIC